ncbi:MAG: hypothetical protein MJA27_02665 [Pseudanabaenales cyanobacterium]|nr:hypothetical protein [Pseudanabaenales cyanobacterium]
MTTQTVSTDCQFCSVISKTNGEDPIGSATPFDKQEFLVPEDQLAQLTTALLQQPEDLNQFESYQLPTHPIRLKKPLTMTIV